MISDPRSMTIVLQRADRGLDLWPLLEAAQYGRIFDHDEVSAGEETTAVFHFVERLGACTEAWEETATDSRSDLMHGLDEGIERLAEQGLYVYWAIVQCQTSGVGSSASQDVLPVGVLRVGRGNDDRLITQLPSHFRLDT